MKDPAKSMKLAGNKVEYTIESVQKTDRLFVIDPGQGLVASKVIGEIKDNSWTLTKDDFSAVYKVAVEVSTPKGPIGGATVELQDASGKRNELIDPASKGIANFFFLKPGEVKVSVAYKAGGVTKDPVRQVFTVGPGKEATLRVALPDGEAVPTAGGASGGNNAPAGPGASASGASNMDGGRVDPGSNPFGNVLMTLIGLAFVGGVGYFFIQFMKKNPDTVKDTMTKLGADIPKPPDPNDAKDPDPIQPIAPQPMQQIILDGGAPAPIAPGPVAPISMPSAAPAAITGIPKLIATDGSAFEIPDGETIVGREFGNGLVVPNDTVSRKHASIHKNGSSVEVQDHGSTNGTWVNGTKVAGTQSVRPGDSIRFGSIEYRYEG